MKEAVIWTQENCVFCVRAKNALAAAGYTIVEKDIGPKGSPERDEFKMFHETTPQVFVAGQHIGTYEQTVAWLAGQAGG